MFTIRKTLISLALALSAVSGAPALAQDATAPVATTTAPAPAPVIASPALWQVADEDTTIYLFGTVHALPAGVEWFRGPIASAFEGSDELVTEIVEGDPAAMQTVVFQTAMLPEGQTLRGLMTEENRTAYEAVMQNLGLPAATFDRFEPWYAAIGLATLPLLRDGYASANGVEAALDARAKALGRPHGALETPEFQLGIFDALPQDVQLRYLADVVGQVPTIKQTIDDVVTQWRDGNAEKLAELMNAEEDDPAMIEALLLGRNRTWAEWIRARMDKPGKVFIAVGAGHLAGEGSVQSLLAERGLSSTRVQ